MYVEKQERGLINKIEYLEDKLLRSKNQHEIEKYRQALVIARKDLQTMQWEKQNKGYY